MSSLSQGLATYACGLEYEDLPAVVIDKLRCCVLYQLGIGLAGHALDSPRQVARLMLAEGAAEQATILLGGQRSSPMNAAFANAALFHARVQDDTHHTSHLGTALIAAGFALAESRHRSGRELLVALAAGYEVAAALGREYTALTTPRGFRASGLYAGLGAAVVAARLLRLDPEQTASAIGIAATLAGGTIQPFASGSEEFLLHNAQAARSGVLAAGMAAQGMQAALDSLEGDAGFLQAFAGENGAVAEVLAGLGQRHEVLEVNFKAQPVCAGNQAPLGNARVLASLIGDPAEIAHIRIEMNPFEAGHPGIASRGPFHTRVQTLMSTPFCVALGLLGRRVDMAALQHYSDAQVLALVGRSEVVACSELQMLHSRIELQLRDGRRLSNRLHLAEEDLRWSWPRVVAFIEGLSEELPCDRSVLAQMIGRVGRLEEEGNWRGLLALLAC